MDVLPLSPDLSCGLEIKSDHLSSDDFPLNLDLLDGMGGIDDLNSFDKGDMKDAMWPAIPGDAVMSDIDSFLREFGENMSSESELTSSLDSPGSSSDGMAYNSCSSEPRSVSDNDDELSGGESMDESDCSSAGLMDLIDIEPYSPLPGASASSTAPAVPSTTSGAGPRTLFRIKPLSVTPASSPRQSHDRAAAGSPTPAGSSARRVVPAVASSGVGTAPCKSEQKPPSLVPIKTECKPPVVVPVSVRGAGTVRAVRILPSHSSNAASPVAANTVRISGGSSGSARLIRVLKGGHRRLSTQTSLPVITFSRSSSSSSAAAAAVGGRSYMDGHRHHHPTTARISITGEERRLLEQEGLPLPCHWPLTRQEEHDLKRIRRKIRNKMSAQDSRKRKKEYYDGLEERVRACAEENRGLHKRLRTLETRNGQLSTQNESLLTQLRRLRTHVARTALGGGRAGGAGAAPPAACLMVLLISMSLCLLPSLHQQKDSASQLPQPADAAFNNAGRTLLSHQQDPLGLYMSRKPSEQLQQLLDACCSPQLPASLDRVLEAPPAIGKREYGAGMGGAVRPQGMGVGGDGGRGDSSADLVANDTEVNGAVSQQPLPQALHATILHLE